MPSYVSYPLVVDTAAIVAQTILDLADLLGIDASELNEGDPVVALAEALATRTAESRILTVDFSEYAYRKFGEAILGVAPTVAASATMATTWTLVDDDGHTIPAGSRVAWRTASGGVLVAFEVLDTVEVDAGETEAEIVVSAVVAGTGGNGHGPGALSLIDPLAYVSAVVSDAASAGGVDAETGPEFSARLAEEAQLLNITPTLEDDFETMARRVEGVHRARAIARYDFANSLADQGGHVTVLLADEDGTDVAAGVEAEVQALFDEFTVIANYVVHLAGPDLTAITVNFVGVAKSGYDPVTVEAAGEAAVAAFLNGGVWAGGDEDPPVWRDETTVRFQDVSAVLNSTPGFDYWTTLTVNAGTVDVALDAIRGLPGTVVVTGTVT